ncbi:alpha/beta hydrolase [Cupriavidus sp. AU9028]|uniref:alpha/beta hydrolase n=1 Tax=Cupriavidus sp. AU9028 TaxID=2871157 RepID=UPI001C966457|nr:alpha/beta hydrolase [Cupriavidus sp. AU9028]MBY4897681.1 lysophospholipase [Cupriavidus sp. AU9028]
MAHDAPPPVETRQRVRDGTELLVRTWEPDPASAAEPLGTLLLVHGMAEHGGRYPELVRTLLALGLRVRAYDHRGHGRSGGARMVTPAPDTLLEDLVQVYDATVQRWPELPLLFGHSMGGLLAARLATARLRPIRALILSSPALGLHLSGLPQTLHRILLTLAPNLRVPSPIHPASLTHDPVQSARYRSDPLVQRTVTAGLLQSILLGLDRAQADAPLLEAPTLVLSGSADRVVDPAAIQRFCDNAPADLCQCVRFEGAYHELLNEAQPWRSQVFDALSVWLRQHLQPAAG